MMIINVEWTHIVKQAFDSVGALTMVSYIEGNNYLIKEE
jgi:hypothetical protein